MNKKNNISQVIIILILLLIAIACILPFFVIIFTSFLGEESIRNYGYTFIPKIWSVEAYEYVLRNPRQLLNAYGLTVFVTITGTVLGMFIMTGCAYALSRNDFKLKNCMSLFIYFTMLFNGGTVATYIWIAKGLHLLNNVMVLILPCMVSPWNIFILRTACKAIPDSIIESAEVEGANEFYIFIRLVIPLVKTGIATIALLVIFGFWNNWYSSMMYMDTSKSCVLQYYLVKVLSSADFSSQNASRSGGLSSTVKVPAVSVRMAICMCSTMPLLCVFPFFQKYFVRGITVGSVKG